MFRSQTRKLKILFGLADAVLVFAAFTLAYDVREYARLRHNFFLKPDVYALLLVFSILMWAATGYRLDVYGKLDSVRTRVVLADSLRQAAICGLAMIVLVYVARTDTSRFFLGLFIATSWVFLLLFRIAARPFVDSLSRKIGAARNVFIVGLGEAALAHARRLEGYHGHGVRVLGFAAPPGVASQPDCIRLEHSYPVHPLDDLRALLSSHVIDEIHFAVDYALFPALEPFFRLCQEEGVCCRIAVDFFPQAAGYMDLEKIGETPLLTFSGAPANEVLLWAKRGIDMVLALAGVILLSPILLVAAALIKTTSRGPVIFRQTRCGLAGRTFTLYKFRSMVEDAESRLDEVVHLNERDAVVMKIRRDPRLTPVGRWLRKFSIDELPQLFNVLRGDMSLVGPRPAIPTEVAQYQRWQRRRLRMRPGLTCLWALRGRDKVDFESWMRLDLQYIDTWSLGLDARIILMTIPQVLSGRGAS
jgi:exopolysaccharide biosynthesis polyprenyl glycosylphosphotransferase